jgi:uncharacterized protein (TIGR04255 family)
MGNMPTERPSHLADYQRPPLDEVVLGVQFEPIRDMTSVHARGIWELFRQTYPRVQEQPQIAPQFETFGGVGQHPSIKFQIGNAPVGSRLWFTSADESHLVQFQGDRFLLNWRRRPASGNYPRFEGIARQYELLIDQLARHILMDFNQELTINQAEVSYINVIPVSSYSELPKWIKLLQGFSVNLEGISAVFTEAMFDVTGRPFARLTHELQTAVSADGKAKLLTLSLTVRGKPIIPGVSGALDFMRTAREAIVTRFDSMTTEQAHHFWEKSN